MKGRNTNFIGLVLGNRQWLSFLMALIFPVKQEVRNSASGGRSGLQVGGLM